MSSGRVANFQIVLLGFFVGSTIGTAFYYVADKYPNSGPLFLASTVPVFISWKAPLRAPLWAWFTGYYAFVGMGVGCLILKAPAKVSRTLAYCLAALLIAHYLVTFLMASEINRWHFKVSVNGDASEGDTLCDG